VASETRTAASENRRLGFAQSVGEFPETERQRLQPPLWGAGALIAHVGGRVWAVNEG